MGVCRESEMNEVIHDALTSNRSIVALI